MELALTDGLLLFEAAFLSSEESERLFAALKAETPWRQEKLKLYGRRIPLPRLTAWYGEPGTAYSYSGISREPLPWTAPLRELKARVEAACETGFNSALLNLYRDGRDSVDWHSDDEPELGPVVASLSLGATRRFLLKHKTKKDVDAVAFELAAGDLLVMKGGTQRHWRHRVPKTAKPVGPRINVTFRAVKDPRRPGTDGPA